MQRAHDMHKPESHVFIFALSIAPTGHMSAHTPQPLHFLPAFGLNGVFLGSRYGRLPFMDGDWPFFTAGFFIISELLRPNSDASFISEASGRPAPTAGNMEWHAMNAPPDMTLKPPAVTKSHNSTSASSNSLFPYTVTIIAGVLFPLKCTSLPAATAGTLHIRERRI